MRNHSRNCKSQFAEKKFNRTISGLWNISQKSPEPSKSPFGRTKYSLNIPCIPIISPYNMSRTTTSHSKKILIREKRSPVQNLLFRKRYSQNIESKTPEPQHLSKKLRITAVKWEQNNQHDLIARKEAISKVALGKPRENSVFNKLIVIGPKVVELEPFLSYIKEKSKKLMYNKLGISPPKDKSSAGYEASSTGWLKDRLRKGSIKPRPKTTKINTREKEKDGHDFLTGLKYLMPSPSKHVDDKSRNFPKSESLFTNSILKEKIMCKPESE